MTSDEVSQWIHEGCDFAQAGEHARAIELFKAAIAQGEAWVGLNLGNSCVALGEQEPAKEAFELAWIEGGDDDAGFNLAHVLEDEGDILQARTIYHRLIESGYSKAMIEEAYHLQSEGRHSDAEQLLIRAMEDVGPVGDWAAGVLGNWRWTGRGSVEELLRRGADAYPSARADLGELLLADDRVDEGLRVLRAGAALDETESMIKLANRLAETGDRKGAAELYRRGFKLGDAHAATNLGAMLWGRGRYKTARKWIQRGARAGDSRAQTWMEPNSESDPH